MHRNYCFIGVTVGITSRAGLLAMRMLSWRANCINSNEGRYAADQALAGAGHGVAGLEIIRAENTDTPHILESSVV